ncbi:MAG: hypothetical protein ACK5QC_09000 [Bacteroidota bacterium]|jgi:hypothetical protein
MKSNNLKSIRLKLTFFMILLALSGITAFPLQTELAFLSKHVALFPSFIQHWLIEVNAAISNTPSIVLYGTDWLAFAHLVIALYFIPVIINPVQYQLNIKMGMIACIAVFPLAFICGPIRGIPFFHQIIDISFGFFGFILLLNIYNNINQLKSKL